MIKIDIERAERTFLEMREERDQRYPHVTDEELLKAVYEGACEYERKRLMGQK